MCIGLYPSQASVIRALYEASAVPTYARLFQLEVSPARESNRDAELAALGVSEGEASAWCLKDFSSGLDEFDEHYENKTEEMKAALEQIERLISALPSTRPKPQLNPEFAGVFARIVEASNLAFETGDWSVFADLYEPGTFACWAGVPDATQFGFLSLPPIPPNAMFRVTRFEEYLLGGRYAFTKASPTHLMEVTYELSRDGRRCGLEKRQRWPRPHFYLVQRNGDYVLTHYCPSQEAIDANEVVWAPPLSAARAAANVALLTGEDWQDIPQDIQRDRYSSRSQDRLMRDHGLGYEEADALIDYVCDPSSTPASVGRQ